MLANKCLYTILFTIILLVNNYVHALTCNGCIDLDDITFDKTIARFPYSIVKFDIAYPYGDKHEIYTKFSRAAHKSTDDLLIATVGIKDYGENENKALGERYDIKDEKEFPVIIIFKGNSKDFIKVPNDITFDGLRKFVSENTELYIGLEGCLKKFHELVQHYANLEVDEQERVMEDGEVLEKKLTKESEKRSARVYLTYMRKINAHGYVFVIEEGKRLQRVKSSRVTDEKKVELQERLNILEAFRVNKLYRVKDEEEKQREKEEQSEKECNREDL